ncbi:MAG TPA: hypothetical protein VLG74_06700 [Blastocatellia bacterium]|nr:hypothetical protein [Blastocatellia bacterium]
MLTFPRLGMPFHMLIDCGVIMGTIDAGHIMTEVVENIRVHTQGRLDVLVVTNRHWDKVSGFIQARDIFSHIEVGQVWLGWTEDPHNPDARRLTRNRGVGKSPPAMEFVRSIAKRVHYWRGGDGPIALSGVAGARVFFLGPPRPSADLREALSAIRAPETVRASPFAERYRISRQVATNNPAFAAYFGGDGEDLDWRQIGKKSLPSIPRLRLDDPASVNETSLAMAIELIGPRGESKVLLFPGNAQAASWFSWHEHRWPSDAAPDDPRAITARKLLERTVLYKVSHYGSRIGTPREFGLEMMTSPDLVAMLSGDKNMAAKRRWQLPAPEILAALDQKTRGRIIRSDPGMTKTVGDGSTLSDSEREPFLMRVFESKLYVDYFVSIPQLTAAERQKSEANWTAANERRVYLVDKKLAGTIKPEEEAELREIEQLMDEYMSTTAPTGLGLLAELRDTVERAKGSMR